MAIKLPGFRIKYLITCIAILVFAAVTMLFLIDKHSKPQYQPTFEYISPQVNVIIDPGHGGLDGGAVSADGTAVEAEINLEIALRTVALLRFFGIESLITRDTAASLNFIEDATIRENKNADLYARMDIMKAYPQCPFLCIHMNNFPQPQYSGAQVFYSSNKNESKPLAESLQSSLIAIVDPSNAREAKVCPNTVYLMREAVSPAVTIECGFLSNEQEKTLLLQEEHQIKLSLAITAGYMDYLRLPLQ